MQSSPSSCNINNLPIQPLFSDNCFNCNSTFSTIPSPSSTLPSTIPDLLEPHHICGSLTTLPTNLPPISTMLPCLTFPVNNWNEDLEQSHRLPDPAQNRWMLMNDGSNMIEADMSYSESNILTNPVGIATQSMVSGDVTPENFEDQMMLTMAVSAAEAGTRMNSLELMWL